MQLAGLDLSTFKVKCENIFYIYKMEVIKYPYSKYQNWFAVTLLLSMISFCLYAIITDSPGDNIWWLMAPCILCLGALLTYLCSKFFFPLLRGETILELDKDKLQYF